MFCIIGITTLFCRLKFGKTMYFKSKTQLLVLQTRTPEHFCHVCRSKFLKMVPFENHVLSESKKSICDIQQEAISSIAFFFSKMDYVCVLIVNIRYFVFYHNCLYFFLITYNIFK